MENNAKKGELFVLQEPAWMVEAALKTRCKTFLFDIWQNSEMNRLLDTALYYCGVRECALELIKPCLNPVTSLIQ